MKIINVETSGGLVLKGVMWNSENQDTVVILMNGLCSNIFQNEFFAATGELLYKNNISFICAQAMDAFSYMGYFDSKKRKLVNTGVVNTDFSKVYEDVEAYVKFAKEAGFKRIILGGHCIGSNKVINYLASTKDDFVDSFIISSPVDLTHFWDTLKDKDMYLETAEQFVKEGRGDDILPFIFLNFSPMSAKTLLDFYHADNLRNCPVISNDGETDSLGAIKINGTFLIGSNDSMTGGDAEGFVKKINSYCQEPEKNRIVIVPHATHIFYGKHNEYASAVLKSVLYIILEYAG